MHKTTVYIEDAQAERLGRLAASSGRSQAELIREGLERVLGEAPPRSFQSMGVGRSGGGRPRRWDAEEVYRKARGGERSGSR
jgi:Ribbon-helix-helix protein, copG family